ncbi:MAG TPA: hypothetical protein VIP98_12630 [Microlunatus sp.]
MALPQPVSFDLGDCRAAHGHIYDIEVLDGDDWTSQGQLAVLRDAITLGGDHIKIIDYHGASHTLLLKGKVGDPSFQARLSFTDCGTAFVGTVSSGDGDPQPIRGVEIEQVYQTERHLAEAPEAPYVAWESLSIKSQWVDKELKITYLLGTEDITDRTLVTHVDRAKGLTTLEMVAEFNPPFRQNAFKIVLASGSRTFSGTYTDDDAADYAWRGGTAAELAAARAKVFASAHASRSLVNAMSAVSATMSLQDLDNISSIQVLTGPDDKPVTVDYAQTTCGGYFNKCLVNALDKKYIDGIYGHPYNLTDNAEQVFQKSKPFFESKSVLGTGQMLYDMLGTSPTYHDLIERINPKSMSESWENLGKSTDTSLEYQEASNALYIAAYRDSVAQIRPYLADNPEQWAERYFNWLSDDANLLTWQIQIASKEFDNVKARMYEWYVKLQVLAPNKDFGERFMTIGYAALLGVNYAKSQWSEDLKPYLQAVIENAILGKVDPAVMDQVQQQAAKENQELLETVITTTDQIMLLVDAISAALTANALKQSLQQAARNPQLQALIGQNLPAAQQQAWNQLTGKQKVGGVLSTLFYGASAGFLIYSICEDAKQEQTPKQIIQEVNLGVMAMAVLVKGIEKMMSLGVGRFMTNFSQAGNGGAFRAFAGDLATWFSEGGKVIPQTKTGKAFVAIFGENSTEFMARRIGPAMAVVGLVLAAVTLYNAIKAGDIRNIIFEALNTFVALATVVLIGFELMSFAWAGPAGLAVAAIGIVIVLIQFIWNLIDPPQPPPDPIRQFVDGPMVDQNFARA